MRKTRKIETEEPLMVDLKGLMALLSCGEYTARKIASDAGAKMVYGRRSLYSVKKVKKFLDDQLAQMADEP